jgi:hypothetical protein
MESTLMRREPVKGHRILTARVLGSGDMDQDGRARAVVVMSPMHRWWVPWLWATWPGADRFPPLKRTLEQLAFIHVAHWSRIRRTPVRGRRGPRLPYPYLIFHSNYNDDLNAYIDAFALIVPWRMRGMWQGIYGFPGPRVTDRFTDFVVRTATPVQHYYCGYPEGSAREIRAALELADHYRAFDRRTRTIDDAEFERAWKEFLTEHQELL